MARKRRRAGGKGVDNVAMPSLTSLMDLITVVLMFLIKTFATSPISVQDPSVDLPVSTSLETVEDSVVVMITGAARRDVGPDGKKVLVAQMPTISRDDGV